MNTSSLDVMMLKLKNIADNDAEVFLYDIVDLTLLLMSNQECLEDIGLLYIRIGYIRSAVHSLLYPQKNLSNIAQFYGYIYIPIETLGIENKDVPVLTDTLVFDCRGLPDPVLEYNVLNKNGTDRELQRILFERRDFNDYYQKLIQTLQEKCIPKPNFTLPTEYKGKTIPYQKTCKLLFLCSGGQHRSVAIAEKIKKYVIENVSFSVCSVEHKSLKTPKRFEFPFITPDYVQQFFLKKFV